MGLGTPMTQTTSSKICVLCGEDCSYKPRIKDSHGNYYCKTCHQAAEQRQTGRKAPSPQPVEIEAAPEPKNAPMIDDLSISLDGEHGNSLGDDIGLAPEDSAGEDEKSLDSNQGIEGMQLDFPVDEQAPSDPPAIDPRDDLNTMLREATESGESEPEENDPYMILKDSISEARPAAKTKDDVETEDSPSDALDPLE